MNNYSGYKTWPFDRKFFLIMNIAVGGNWGGAQGIDNNAFPATMNIDYVRYYKFIQ
jgi:beta-glucanase (GH16 family)